MNFISLFKKSRTLIKLNLLNHNKFILPNLYLNKMYKEDFAYIKTILFYFDNVEYMHLGDHLFFIPLIKSFQDSGYKVEVLPTAIMQQFFEKLGFKIGKRDFTYESYDLIISRIEMIDQLYRYKAVLVNVSKNLTMPICDQLVSDFSVFVKLNKISPIIDYSALKDDKIYNKFNLSTDRQLILFNLYCDAASYLITKSKKKLILDKLKEFNDSNLYQLVFVGSQSDKLNDRMNYEFDYLDLRGMTSVIDIFAIANLSNSRCYVGFDAFVMHVFSLLNKPSYVVFRGRLSKKQHNLLKVFHVNLFKHDNYVTLLNE